MSGNIQPSNEISPLIQQLASLSEKIESERKTDAESNFLGRTYSKFKKTIFSSNESQFTSVLEKIKNLTLVQRSSNQQLRGRGALLQLMDQERVTYFNSLDRFFGTSAPFQILCAKSLCDETENLKLREHLIQQFPKGDIKLLIEGCRLVEPNEELLKAVVERCKSETLSLTSARQIPFVWSGQESTLITLIDVLTQFDMHMGLSLPTTSK